MLETRNDRCPEKIFRTYLAERLAYFRTKGPFYLAVTYNPPCAIWFKRSSMGVHATNNIIKSLLETSKHITSYLAQNNVANAEIISISGHSTAERFYPYDSGDEKQKLVISNTIDNCSVKPISYKQHFIPTNDPRILNATFSFFQQADFQQNIPPLHVPINLGNCNIQVYQNPPTMSTASVEKNHEPLKKRLRVMYSSDFSQEIS